MLPAERSAVVEALEQALTPWKLLSSLSPRQAAWQPAPDRWSITANAEHVTLVETAMFANMEKGLAAPADPEILARTRGRDERLSRGILNRTVSVPAPAEFVPSGRFGGLPGALAAFEAVRRRTIQFAATTQADLRAHTHRHFLLKDMDAYQWLIFLAAHGDRHLAQVRDVMADPSFPVD